ncbi:MAG: hypothetical protein LBF75_05575, partial [Treponema sp.]|nr:hypothetical protein [Treponema sp.]
MDFIKKSTFFGDLFENQPGSRTSLLIVSMVVSAAVFAEEPAAENAGIFRDDAQSLIAAIERVPEFKVSAGAGGLTSYVLSLRPALGLKITRPFTVDIRVEYTLPLYGKN